MPICLRAMLGGILFGILFLIAQSVEGKPIINPDHNEATHIGDYCEDVQSYVPTIVAIRDSGEMTLAAYKSSIKRRIIAHNILDLAEAKKMLWLVDRVYASPDKDAHELQGIIDFECKAALLDGTWYQ